MKHLKELLVAKGKTQTELAEILGRDKSAITNLLQGKRQLKASEVPAIATFLGVSELQILGLAPEGMAEGTRIPFQGAPSTPVLASGQLVEQNGQYFLDDSEGLSEQCFALEVSDRSLDLQGLIPGDVVICDPSKPPKSGDVVVSQHYQEDGSANTVLRLFQAPFLNSHSSQVGFERLHQDRTNVAVMATVIRAIRFYP